MAYTIELLEVADEDLKGFATHDQQAIVKKIREQLTDSPFPHGNTIKRLQGFDVALYRLRVNAPTQSYRVYYQVNVSVVRILRIVSKKDSDKVIRVLKRYGIEQG